MDITAGSLGEEFAEGAAVILAHGETVYLLLLKAEVATEVGNVVDLCCVISGL